MKWLSGKRDNKEAEKPAKGGSRQAKSVPRENAGLGDPEKRQAVAREYTEVVFVKEYTEISLRDKTTFRIYRCEDPLAATVFLKRRENIVNRRDLCIEVKTPSITYYRDINGIHEKDQT